MARLHANACGPAHDDGGRPLPAGETGHLRARGARFPTEYLGSPEASQKAFRDGWFYPGDLAQRNLEGAFFFHGRADDLMNFDGVKIAPADIEAALMKHPAVVEAAAFPLPSALHQDLPAAAVVLRHDTPAPRLIAFCQELLGARRSQVVAIVRALPRSAAGKILKRELAKRIAGAAAGEGGQGG
jgi:acyl-coenzyme A synthetase/AMP-(fatty) acid ligase